MKEFELYVDGFCSGNPGPGGWSVVSVEGGEQVWDSGRKEATTNNEMELAALLRGLGYVDQVLLEADVEKVVIVSDSRWMVDVVAGLWRGAAHLDLVRLAQREVALLGKKVEVRWERKDEENKGGLFAGRVARAEARRRETTSVEGLRYWPKV